MIDTIKIKQKMIEKGYTQTKLAKELGISVSALSYKLNGEADFWTNEAKKISDILDIQNPEEIFFKK